MENVIADIPWARRLKLRHFEVFLILVSYGNLTAAANALHMTQPAVSHWLKDLERLVGMPLFVRGRQSRLTEAGEALRRHAEGMLGDVRRTHEELDAIRTGNVGHIHVGAVLAAAPFLLPKAIARIQRAAPGLAVSVREATFDVLLDHLQKHELDVIVARLPSSALEANFPCELLLDDPVHIVSGPDHPLAKKDKPSWRDAARFPWIMPPAGTPMRLRLEAAFAEARITLPKPAVESVSILTNQMLLREADYLGVLSGSVARHYKALGLMSIVKLRFGVRVAPVGMLWRLHEPNMAMQRLLEALRIEANSTRTTDRRSPSRTPLATGKLHRVPSDGK